MPKRKKSTNQSESLFNTGAYSSKIHNHASDPGWDDGVAFLEIHNINPTDIDEHLSSTKLATESLEVNNSTNQWRK